MLDELHVEGYALISRLTIKFTKGLNVLSGETGAGKSILIGALSLLLGEKGDASAIRTGADEARVTGVIRVDGSPEAQQWLMDRGIEPEDGQIILTRTLRPSGKGQVSIQSTPSTRAALTELTGFIFDMHGQHQHQSLLKVDTHRELIDTFGGHRQITAQFHEAFVSLADKKKALASLAQDERERLREQDLFAFATQEIGAAKLKPGEEEELLHDIQVLAQSERLSSLLQSFHEEVAEGSGGGLSGIRNGIQALSEMATIDSTLGEFSARLDNAFYEIEDVSESIRQYQDGIDFSSDRLEECEERLSVIRRLENKYGASVADVMAYADECEKKLARLENWEDEKKALSVDVAALEKKVISMARDLSERRKAAADRLSGKIQQKLIHLGMPKAAFRIEIGQRISETGKPVCGPWGMDRPEFLITANPGEAPKPLRRIASGGEMSRVMLAMKSVLADADTIQALIFDEIDAGIGGEVAISVASHLKELSARKQVLCITHLATIAVQADNHIKVEKRTDGSHTETALSTVSGEELVSEVARMLAGDSVGQTSRAHAEEMLRSAGKL
jgi:DNA repair protein RecN (Recombination protein N)